MIEINDIEKSFGKKVVLDKLSLKIKEHDIYGLLGANGSGKTTTINILCNLLDADKGQIRINQNPLSKKTREDMGIVPQENSIYQDLTCKENLEFFGRLYGLVKSEINYKFDGNSLSSISLQEIGLEHVYLEVTQN